MHEIKIRYNTEKDKSDHSLPAWRVLVDGVEFLATEVDIQVASKTTEDVLSAEITKWHISCFGHLIWNDKRCKIVSAPIANS